MLVLRSVISTAREIAAVSLAVLSALHILWSTGSAWPAPDREALADLSAGCRNSPGLAPVWSSRRFLEVRRFAWPVYHGRRRA